MYLFLILLIPVLWFTFAKYVLHQTITWAEALSSVACVGVVTSVVYLVSVHRSLSDTATVNGQVTSKSRDKVSCGHSYNCRCRRVKCGKSHCTHCDTCYEHSYDVDWRVKADVGAAEIERVDRQGLTEPNRWTVVKVGDPFSTTEQYTNYIKGAPDSLFNRIAANKYLGMVPEYPQNLYDHYKMDRLVTYGVQVPDVGAWNAQISDTAKILGVQKKANVVVFLTKETDENFAEAVAYKWFGGKKNDILVVIGTYPYPSINWVRVFTYSKDSMFQVVLRDELLGQKTLDPYTTLYAVKNAALAHYQRKSMDMEEFRYLENEVEPPTWVLVTAVIVCLLLTAGLTWSAHKHDWFGNLRWVRSKRRW